jgi:hypothetical protein
MYQANLSYRLLCRYLEQVVDAGLVRSEDECFALTPKGRDFLDRHEKYSKRRKSLEQHLDYVNGEKVALEKMCMSLDRTSDDLNRLGRNKGFKKQRN